MLLIEQSVADKMIAGVEPDQQECCGFFFGHESKTQRTVTKSENVSNSVLGNRNTNFEISMEDYMEAEKTAERENLAFLGVYHSHPNQSAIPSDYDQEMALPCFSYIIISVANQKFKKMRSWQLDNNLQFMEEEIVFIQSSPK